MSNSVQHNAVSFTVLYFW